MKKEHFLQLFEQVAPEPLPINRFRIAEVYLTVDGYRTRLTHHCFATREEAMYELARMESEQ